MSSIIIDNNYFSNNANGIRRDPNRIHNHYYLSNIDRNICYKQFIGKIHNVKNISDEARAYMVMVLDHELNYAESNAEYFKGKYWYESDSLPFIFDYEKKGNMAYFISWVDINSGPMENITSPDGRSYMVFSFKRNFRIQHRVTGESMVL